jgi:hypothetical protein
MWAAAFIEPDPGVTAGREHGSAESPPVDWLLETVVCAFDIDGTPSTSAFAGINGVRS